MKGDVLWRRGRGVSRSRILSDPGIYINNFLSYLLSLVGRTRCQDPFHVHSKKLKLLSHHLSAGRVNF